MEDQSATLFPVGNGDTTRIRLSDGSTILVDCHIREAKPGVYDAHGHLADTLREDDEGRLHLDAFILTHPDRDHCGGFPKVFYTGDPAQYSDEDTDAERIIIDELWFAPGIFQEYKAALCEDAKSFREEAERRIDLYCSGSSDRRLPGNRLRVIGASDNDALDGLGDILTIPGNTVNLINGKKHDDFRFFVYAPVKADSDDENGERNDTSIVLQARFDVDGTEDAARIFLGGDAGCAKWERIIDVNDDDNLEWDIFLAPHHCSWSFFSSDGYDPDDPEPSEDIMHLLNLKRGRAYVVSSSKSIKDDGDNPPCYDAKEIYESVVGEERFLCTGEHPDEDDPEPVHFTMTQNGPVKDELREARKSQSHAHVETAVSEPRFYG